jgi:hypothetical protein
MKLVPPLSGMLEMGMKLDEPNQHPSSTLRMHERVRPRESLNVWPTSCPPAAVICAQAHQGRKRAFLPEQPM